MSTVTKTRPPVAHLAAYRDETGDDTAAIARALGHSGSHPDRAPFAGEAVLLRVVVGSRSHNFLYEVFLGSVAKEVIRKSDMPVLILRLEPRGADRAAGAGWWRRGVGDVYLREPAVHGEHLAI